MREPLCGAAPAGREVVCAFCVALGRSVVFAGAWSCVAGTHGRVRWLCPIHKPHNKRIQPTASLAALASRRLMREPLGGIRLGGLHYEVRSLASSVIFAGVFLGR